jgi:predicted kinase
LGDVFLVTKDDETATNLYIVALDGFTHMDIHCSRAQCMVRLGDLANVQGHTSKAIGFWTTARQLLERSLQAKDMAQIDVRLSTMDKAHQKYLLQFTTLSAPDRALNRETSESQEVETICLDVSPESVFSTS